MAIKFYYAFRVLFTHVMNLYWWKKWFHHPSRFWILKLKLDKYEMFALSLFIVCCRDEIERNELGSRPLQEIMDTLQPSFWFSAHMHVKFAACVSHMENTNMEKSSVSEDPGDGNVS